MSTAVALLDLVQTQVLDVVKQSQEFVVDAVRTATEVVEPLLPDLSSLPIPQQLPQPAAIVSSSFDFAQKLIEGQQEFVKGLLAATKLGEVEVTPTPAARTAKSTPKAAEA